MKALFSFYKIYIKIWKVQAKRCINGCCCLCVVVYRWRRKQKKKGPESSSIQASQQQAGKYYLTQPASTYKYL